MRDSELKQASEDLFFLAVGSRLVAWDYRHHQQYELSVDHVRALIDSGFAQGRPDIVEELEETNLLVPASKPRTSWGWDALSRVFHLGTSLSEESGQNLTHQEHPPGGQGGEVPARSVPSAHSISMSGRQTPPTLQGLLSVLEGRTTSRTFNPEPLPLDSLALVLSETFRFRTRAASEKSRHRSSPSAGGLQACRSYVIVRNVERLDPGLYRYESDTDVLEPAGTLPAGFDLARIAWNQKPASQVAATVVITAQLDALWARFRHSRGYRLAYLDAGHLSQTLQLVATGLALKTWSSSAFRDSDLTQLLSLPSSEVPIHLVGLSR